MRRSQVLCARLQGPVIRLLWKMSHGLGEGGPGQPPSELLGWAMSGGAPGVDAGAGAYTPVGFRPAVAMHGADGTAGSPAHLASPLGMSASGMAEDDQDRVSAACGPLHVAAPAHTDSATLMRRLRE